MKKLIFIILLFAWADAALAHWPITVNQDLAIGDSLNYYEGYPEAVPGADNRTLIAYFTNDLGVCYQVLDRFGNPLLPPETAACPDLSLMASYGIPKVVADDEGGMLIAWHCNDSAPQPGIYAQRVDSSGNRLWGTSGVWAYPPADVNFDICSDSQGGFWLAVARPEGSSGPPRDLYVQRLSGSGQLLLGPNGVPVVVLPQVDCWRPKLAPDGQGGCYLAWDDARSPSPYYDVFTQHLGGQGQRLWNEDLYICNESNVHTPIPDGEGGFILQTNPGENFVNTHQRLNAQGQILWTIQGLSYDFAADMVVGQPGYFYLAYLYSNAFYAQKVSLSGGNTWGGGVPMSSPQPGWIGATEPRIRYRYPYLYGCFALERTPSNGEVLRAQRLDSLGNRCWGTMGTLLSKTNGHYTEDGAALSAMPDGEGGFVAVWEITGTGNVHDVYAKRCNADGSLGGPFPLKVTITPHNLPLQIPYHGGSLIYSLAVADTDSVGGYFDLWVEVVLPGGFSLELAHSLHQSVAPDMTFLQEDLQQIVPGRAPAGTYSYHVYAGNWAYRSPWGQDSFSFTKLGIGTSEPVAGDWTLHGGPFSPAQGNSTESPSPLQSQRLSVFPNPFNSTTALSYYLPQAGKVRVQVFDTAGRLVKTLAQGRQEAGAYSLTFTGNQLPSGVYLVQLQTDDHLVTRKMLLLK